MIDACGSDRRHEPRTDQVVERSAAREVGIGAIQQIFRLPELRLPAGQHELLGPLLSRQPHPLVDAVSEGDGNAARVRAVTLPLAFEVAAELDAAGHRVALDEVRPHHLGQASLCRALPQVHLEQAVLRLHEPLREEQVFGVGGGDVRNAEGVAVDADVTTQAGEVQVARDLRPRWRGRCGFGATAGRAGQRAAEAENDPGPYCQRPQTGHVVHHRGPLSRQTPEAGQMPASVIVHSLGTRRDWRRRSRRGGARLRRSPPV